MPFISIDGCRFHYRLDGPPDAKVLLLSHSLGNDLRMWESQMPAFTQHFRVLRYDSRGHGQTPTTPGPYSIEQLGHDVVAILQALGIARVDFCGLSMGGMVGMWLATNAPDLIDHLVLCNTSPKLGPPSRWDERIRAVESGGMAAVADAAVERWFTPSFRQSSPTTVERVIGMTVAMSAEGYVASCAAIRDMDQTDAIDTIAHRTLVVVGEYDPATPPASGALIAQKVRHSTLVSLPAAHLSNIEAASDFNRAVVSFLIGGVHG